MFVIEETKEYIVVKYENGFEQKFERVTICPECGVKITIYKQLFNKVLASALIKLASGKPVRVGTDYFTKSEYGNLSKLRHWDLIEEIYHEDKKKKKMGGVWKITMKGLDFLKDNIKLPKYAWIGNNKLYAFSKEIINIKNVPTKQSHIGDFEEQAKPHILQESLF